MTTVSRGLDEVKFFPVLLRRRLAEVTARRIVSIANRRSVAFDRVHSVANRPTGQPTVGE
jgi:hypothetical protein